MKNIETVNEAIHAERSALLQHKLYSEIKTLNHLQLFTQYHVFAVWDFMSLLKALQIQLTCTQVPWFATPAANTRYLINEIVLAEESDEYIDGSRLSHYEMYLDAMQTIGADPSIMSELAETLKNGNALIDSINNLPIDVRVKDFLHFTFSVIQEGKSHNIASAFTFGREDLIPDMFTAILKEMQQSFPNNDLSKLIYYFQRHIELDGDEHGPLAMTMIQELAGDSTEKWQEITETAQQALQKRIALWDAIYDAIKA